MASHEQGPERKRRARAQEGDSRRKHTINDVARMAGVSKKTVSRVINASPFVKEETRKAVLEIIRETGYTPDPQARGLAFRRSFLVGLIYDNPNPQHTVSHQLGILDALKGTGFELLVRPVDRTSPKLLEDMRGFVERQKLYGVVLPSPVSENEDLVALMKELGCRYVRIASVPMDDAACMVVSHDGKGAADAARHLADLGHTRIALISGPPTFRSSVERRRGFEAGLAERGLALDPALVKQGAYTYESGITAAGELFALENRPTAIFCLNDEMASGAYLAAREHGLSIPKDVSIVGFDDAPIAARLWPALTSVRLPLRDMGRMAGEMLVPDPLREVQADAHEVQPELIVRESTAKAG
ncbi:LacI family DNA-binding transcriptional regulator [Phenylobacterium aquaticum]|uniref:LacI family DNA-binding transcriptional regulator n=1 Tax=Phenylobacterium aquaticum TaxID=1763816 RepID=UPI001F5D5211|nr:LacI family DNA-binding transcriptional regulator [Phenylobacterium aquaticum]